MWSVGYQRELAQLRACIENASRGQGQFVFISGEVGIGKTTLIRRFLGDLPAQRSIRTAYGRCFAPGREGLGCLPVLEALSGLCRGSDGQHMLDLLRKRAPTWRDQMPAFNAASETELEAHEASDASFDRMLKELADFIEACTAEQPLVLVLEDLHANGQMMAELINYLARREKSAAFMLIASYCNSPSLLKNHPLKLILPDLKARGACLHLSLAGLDEAAVGEFVTKRLPTAADPLQREIARRLFDESEGNPLLMIQLMDHWAKSGVVDSLTETPDINTRFSDPQISIPESVQEWVDASFELLDPAEQRMLEAASVNGSAFSALMLAHALGEDVVAVEECCERLARQQQFLKSTPQERWPERRSASRYAFTHRLYQLALFRRLPIASGLRHK